ncbi:class I SAM-dependent methyltransferase [Variovorax sp. 770b2]|uniref:class I SAM-dependent methyltransferase n=1 Tax=Variovorax sp. 770b2 TaxID=1566271 RepID=UPI0008E510EE|nr:class I SAM-dependent methyltransferase [Variovorax sp. 770b2]SFQ26072.1 C-methyltransferase C-terminal domain-containing protein [Variovorax sp. 770b2]
MQRELLHIERLPVLQNRVYGSASAGRASPRGDMTLAQDNMSGLVSNVAFDPSLLAYDADYQNEQAHSAVFREHLQSVLSIIGRHFKGRTVIEVGCGKGYFLNYLREAGYEATGIDPAYEGDSSHVVKAAFSPALGLSADALVLRHVLEHIQDPLSFLRAIAAANGGRGSIYIEVPCFDWICARHAWFDIFYEHVNYFRASDFQRMFGRIHEQGHVFGGQYLYVVADLATLRAPVADASDRVELPADFLSGVEASKVLARATPGPKAIWGASSKGVIFAHHLRGTDIGLAMAVDINPVKQNRYMAGTGLRIVSPHAALEALPADALVFVMNSNYFDEILEQSQGKFRLVKVDQNDIRS